MSMVQVEMIIGRVLQGTHSRPTSPLIERVEIKKNKLKIDFKLLFET